MRVESTPSPDQQETGKRGRTGLHGNQRRGRRVAYAAITCEVCGKVREYKPSEVRVRGVIRFCSRACCAKAQERPESHVMTSCSQCGESFQKRRDHLRERNYCSPACSAAAQRVEGAAWRDPEQIKAYMRRYAAHNRQRINELSQAWAKANRDKRNEQQQRRRAQGARDAAVAVVRQQMIARYGERCLCCGATERIEVDHIVPVSKGGEHRIENVQPLCRSCNAAKGDKVIDYRKAAG